MMMAKVFENGRSQAVRLPKEYRFSDENKWSGFLNSLNLFSEDFMSDGHETFAAQEREAL